MDEGRLSEEIEPISPRTMRRINLSPQMLEKKLQHQIDIDDERTANELENSWKSCCMTCDKRGIVYFTQTFTILLIIIFCLIKLSGENDEDDKVVYASLLNMAVGIMIPSPQLRRSDK